MIDAVERLARGHDFLCDDYYEVGGQSLFGELCLYPRSGLNPFDPLGLDEWVDANWSAERREVSR